MANLYWNRYTPLQLMEENAKKFVAICLKEINREYKNIGIRLYLLNVKKAQTDGVIIPLFLRLLFFRLKYDSAFPIDYDPPTAEAE